MDPFVKLDATGQAELVKRGEATSVELVDAAIARIEALEPSLNALTCRLFDRARDEARRVDAEKRFAPPFAGVPFLVKDLAALGGAPLTYGSRFFARKRVRNSEPSVQASLDAGLIPVGKTNTPEMGLLGATEPLLFGPTRNPWALDRSAGGSSGGSAAAVAAGMVPIAGAGDGGGSIRIPASCCGLFGLKPSRGRAIPPLNDTPGDLSVHLCVSRSVRDTARLLQISEIRGFAGAFEPVGYVAEPSSRRLRIAVGRKTVTGADPDPDVAAALDDAAALCAALGHHVEEAEPDFDGGAAIDHFMAFWSEIPATILRFLWALRLMNWNWRPVEEGFEPWTLGLADWNKRRKAAEGDIVARGVAFFAEVGAIYAEFFERYDVVLTPVLRSSPPEIGAHAPDVPFETLLARLIDYVGYTPIFNGIGAPAISAPLSMNPAGLPLGAHFAAKVGDDALLLQLAYELEQARPWSDLWPAHSAVRLSP